MESPFAIEIEIEPSGAELRVTARGSRGERPAPHSLGPDVTIDRLDAFAKTVGRAVKKSKALDEAALSEARALYAAVFSGGLRDLSIRVEEAAKDSLVLHRLFLRDRGLQAVPWEALCAPGTTEGFWGTSPQVTLARGVTSPDPWEPREVLGPVRVLVVAPTIDADALDALRSSLSGPIDAGEVEWLEPISGPKAAQQALFGSIRRGKSPHVLHFVGHGGIDAGGNPTLRLTDDEDGEEVWIKVEALARELSSNFQDDLRLVVLEACEGAAPGALGSAAELLGRAGADAVVAHLWPVKSDVARACSTELYQTLTRASSAHGDVAASLAAARRTLLLQSAEGFSPVLFVRGAGTSVFSFDGRSVAAPKGKGGPRGGQRDIAPALLGLFERPFSIVVGDSGEGDRATLKAKLQAFLVESGDAHVDEHSLATLAQRCELRFGLEKLSELFQDTFWETIDAPPSPLLTAIAPQVGPGVHVTLLWFSALERALAAAHPNMTIYGIQPSIRDSGGKPRVVKRARGASAWTREPGLPKSFDFKTDIVVLRVYGGYLPEPRPIFTGAMLTEDDHLHGLISASGFRPPGWAEELVGRLRLQPALFVGLSVLEWRHRMLLRWLYDERPAPKDSLALLDADVDPAEIEIWETGGGLPGTGRIAAVHDELDDLAAALSALPAPTEAQ